ncbi:serine protease [Dongia sp.]|uniref:trypsin-like serine peptidase n=1 Tax=Dongia sp. TaxID=1977262 RepID=UPI0035B11ADE
MTFWRGKPGRPGVVARSVGLGILLLVLAGCAARPPVIAPTPVPVPEKLPWTAAIGQLSILQGGGRPCTAVLVASDLIVTAAHCLYQEGRAAPPTSVVFHPNFGAQPELGQYRGATIRAIGSVVRQGRITKGSEVAADWVLLSIDPPVRAIEPVPVARLTTQQILDQLANGADLFTAGYGYGATKVLRPHGKCRIVSPRENKAAQFPSMLVTDCIIRIGDSGGPIALLDKSGRPSLIGIFSGFGVNGQTGLAFGSNASNFAPYLDSLLISQWLGS